MNVQAQIVGLALSPRDDVRGAEERGVIDVSQRAAAIPIFEQRIPENVLANADDGEPFGFSGPGQIRSEFAEDLKRCVGQANAELVGAVEGVVKAGQFREGVGRMAGCVGDFGAIERNFGNDARVRDGHEPIVLKWVPSDPNFTACGGRAVANPTAMPAKLDSKPILISSFVGFLDGDEGW